MRVNIMRDWGTDFCIPTHLLLIFLPCILDITTFWNCYNTFFKHYRIGEAKLEDKTEYFSSQIRIKVKPNNLTYITSQAG